MTGAVAGTTRFFGLKKVRFDANRWQDIAWSNLDIIDTVMNAISGLTNIVGEWENSTAYTVGQRVVDNDDGTVWQCAVAHTSAASGDFEADRDDNPTYWDEITSLPAFRGEWETGVLYNVQDYVVDGYRYGIVVESFTSGASYDADEAAGNIVTLIDLTEAIEAAEDLASGLVGTSSTNVAVGTGSKIFTTQTNKQWVVGTRLRVSNAGVTRVMEGEVTAYASDTLTISVDYTEGSGSDTTWSIGVAGAVGSTGPQGDPGPPGAGSGDVLGPATNADDRIATWDGVNSLTLQDSGSTVADVLARANHTGTQAQSTITDLVTDLAAKIAKSLLTTAGDLIYATGSATPARLAIGTAGLVLRTNAGASAPEWGQVQTAGITDENVTLEKLVHFDALSVLARAVNSSGDPSFVAAGSDHQILRRSGSGLSFGAVNLAQAAAVTGVLPAGNLPDASDSAEGIVELATAAETETGTDTGRVLTPADGEATYIKKSLLTTRGDIIYRNATVPARLAKGTAGQVLTMGANDPQWSDNAAIPTTTTLPVGYAGLMIYTDGSSIAAGGTVSGASLRIPAFLIDDTAGGAASIELGTVQTGTWTNLSGTTINPDTGQFALSFWKRTA